MGADSGFDSNRPDIIDRLMQDVRDAKERSAEQVTEKPEENEVLPLNFDNETVALAHPIRWLRFRRVLKSLGRLSRRPES